MVLGLLAAGALIIPTIPVHGDIIFYRNQRYVKGKVIGQTIATIRFRRNDGTIIEIQKRKIRKILYINDTRQSELDREAKERREARRRREAAAAKKRAEEAKRAAEKKAREDAERKRREAARLEELRKKAQENAKREFETRRSKRLGGLWRSALLPGWGQYYQGRKKRAAAFWGGFGGGALLGLYFVSRYNVFQKDHDFAVNRTIIQTPALAPGSADIFLFARNVADAQGSRRRLERGSFRANTMVTLLFGLYIWNLVDVYYFDLSADKYFAVGGGSDGLSVGFHFRY